ncbi:S-adenosyl-L-methionine-dependent methyltransferase [Testicularia cyperi]|uniref:S-adenosyl-L-methionine-dependent methyltransferase n=1 Tax=Testicularia cyperi TaxID=1882483 RepID=A0A317XV43_9BASI|nr:S-adenosyl-L-methionine-dependent methyltransferase [Testicularia cyperi]
MVTPFDVARLAIDACHKKDPAYLDRNSAESKDKKDELSYADGVEKWASHIIGIRMETPEFHAFAAEVSPSLTSDVESITRTSELLKLAARCQHLERFLTPRSTYPDGKAGYLKWRRDLYTLQANRAKELLVEAGIQDSDAEWVRKWVSKTELHPGKDTGDLGTQLLEDAAVLVFLEDELELFAAQHAEYTEQKLVDIIKKTWRKLSPIGKQEALKLSMPKGVEPIVLKGIAAMEAAQQQDTASDTRKKVSSSAPYTSGTFQRALRPKTAAEAEAMLAARAAAAASAAVPVDLFGARLLKDQDAIWDHNAWDHVEPPPEHYEQVAETLARQAETKLSLDEAEEFHANPAGYWDTFYSAHENRFFKDRRWLHLEFPELVEATLPDRGGVTILEVGCGAGNTVFPLLEINQNPMLEIHACDYSAEAVSVVRSNPSYSCPSPKGARCESNVWDLSSPTALPPGLHPGSVDIIVLIFVFSALHPREWTQAVLNIKTLLKPAGIVLFRDYGRYDLPQLRFKKRRMLQDNFYLRGDGTRVYFFEPDELVDIFNASPPEPPAPTPTTSAETTSNDSPTEPAKSEHRQNHDFETLQMAIDRRLIVNRKERKRMYRVWLQSKFRILP